MLTFSVQLNRTPFRQVIVDGLPPWLLGSLRFVKARAIRSFYLPKSGRPGPVRRRSRAGQPPASQTKQLEQSFTEPRMITGTTASMNVNAPYAATLEFDRDRAFVRPAIEDLRAQFARGRVRGI